MRFSRVLTAVVAVGALTAGTAAAVSAAGGNRTHEGCKLSGVGVAGVDQQAALARHRALSQRWRSRNVDLPLSRACVIAIAETYVQDLLVDERPDDTLLNDDVVRWTQQNHAETPRDTSAEEIREATRQGAEATVEDIVNRRWVVDGNEAIMIGDIIVTGLAEPVTLYERFLIRFGQIAEIEAIFLAPS